MNINNGVKGEKSTRRNNTMCDTSHMKVERNSLTMFHSLDLGVDFTERGKPESLEKNPQRTGDANYKTGTWTVVKLKCSGHVSEFRTEIKPVTF